MGDAESDLESRAFGVAMSRSIVLGKSRPAIGPAIVLALAIAAIAGNRMLIERARAAMSWSAPPVAPLPPTIESPRIVIEKRARRLTLYSGDRPIATYRVGLGFSPVGPKFNEGDGRTPEGELRVVTRNEKSRFRKFLGLSYPRPSDARGGAITPEERTAIAAAFSDGKAPPWNTPLGGAVGIHGHGAHGDWTSGCIALDNDAIDALWNVIPLGTPVTIAP
jgi:hypothetical protein